jgi:hypothetical protein
MRPYSPQATAWICSRPNPKSTTTKTPAPHGRFLFCGTGFAQRGAAAGGTVSISLPVNTIGPVATPVGDPPSGSTVTA